MSALLRAVNHPAAHVIAVFAASRLVTLGVLLVARLAPIEPPITGSITDLLCRHDCLWYVRIATDGYSIESPPGAIDATAYAFFPLYPLLIQLASTLTGLPELVSGIVIANAAAAVALVYVYYYGRDLALGHRSAMLAVTLIAFGPASVVFSSAFTEGVFLLLLAAAAFHLRREEYGRAAIAAALLSATRPTGIAFAFFAAAWLLRRHGRSIVARAWSEPQMTLPLVAAPLGLVAFWAFSLATTGDAFASVSANFHGWGWGATNALEQLTLLTRLDPSDQLLVALSGLALGTSLLLLRYGLVEELVLVLASLAIIWTGGLAPWSMPRFVLVLFPLWLAVGIALRRRPGAAGALLAVLATLNGFILVVGWAMGAFVV